MSLQGTPFRRGVTGLKGIEVCAENAVPEITFQNRRGVRGAHMKVP